MQETVAPHHNPVAPSPIGEEPVAPETDPAGYVPPEIGFACVPGTDPSTTLMRRLSKRQYTNTLEALAGSYFDPPTTLEVLAALAEPLLTVPNDANAKLRALDQSLTQEHVTGHFEVAAAFAEAATSDSTRLGALVGECAVDGDPTNDDWCIDDFIVEFGGRVLRRPVTEAEAEYFREVYDDDSVSLEAVRDLVTLLLCAPQFVFHVENGTAAVASSPDLYAVSAYELASRLSFLFWQSMPDAELVAAAADGSLLTEDGYAAQVQRVFADPRTQGALDGFFSQWLHIEDTLQHSEVQRDMHEEVRDLVRHTAWDTAGGFSDLFMSTASFAKTKALADVYGVPVWVEGTPPPVLPAGERAGLLTRAAFVASAGLRTKPIMKGIFIRERILCDELGAPPPEAQNAKPDFSTPMTTREQTAELTQQPGSACAGCHNVINPLGFATESYGPDGRFRTEEDVLDTDGALVATLPIDTNVVPAAAFTDPRWASDGIEMSALVLDSGKAQACFARHYFRFATGRLEDLTQDACVLEQLRQGLEGTGASLRDTLKSVALMPEFKLRKRGAK